MLVVPLFSVLPLLLSSVVSQPVGTHPMPPACLWINQNWQPGPFSTLSYYLPGSVPIDAKDEHFALSQDWTATLDVIPQYSQGIAIDGERPYPAALLFLNQSLFNLLTTSGAKSMAPAQPCSTVGAGQLETALEVLDSDGALVNVYILELQS